MQREKIFKFLKRISTYQESEFLPTVTLSGSKSEEDTKKLTDRTGANSSITDVNPKSQSVVIEQKIFKGFAGIAGLQKSKIGLVLADAKLLKVEQEVLYSAIEAYSGLVFANEKLQINETNLNLLERQVETDQARLERGQITLADLAQSESSFAGAQAKFIQAKNETVTAKLEYEKIIGPITDLDSLSKKLDFDLNIPESLNNAIEISKINSPDLIIARLDYEQSEKDVIIARADLSPSATISLSSTKTDDLSSSYDESEKEIAKATISWPIFKGGKNTASLNRSKNLAE